MKQHDEVLGRMTKLLGWIALLLGLMALFGQQYLLSPLILAYAGVMIFLARV